MRRTLCRLLVILLLPWITGCVNYYHAHYRHLSDLALPPCRTVEVIDLSYFSPDDFAKFCQGQQSQGAFIIGHSDFIAKRQSSTGAKRQAKLVGADTVYINTTFSSRETGIFPLVQNHPAQSIPAGTAVHQGTMDVYGSHGGYGYGTYRGTSTYYQEQPAYTTVTPIPYTVDYYRHVAVYVRRTDHPTD